MSARVASVWERGERRLGQAGVPRARAEAALLLGHLLGRSDAALRAHDDESVEPVVAGAFERLCERRAAGEPLAYLTGRREFWSLDLRISPGVLIPRPETEHLVEAALEVLGGGALRIADAGTGSGCVGLALARERPECLVVALDRSPQALALAIDNARRLGLADRFHAVRSDGLGAVHPGAGLDAIVSNPPYVPLGQWPGLMKDVRDHEPLGALSPGSDGLAATRRLVGEAAERLRPGGWLLFEIDPASAPAALELPGAADWEVPDLHRDLEGRERVVRVRRLRGRRREPAACCAPAAPRRSTGACAPGDRAAAPPRRCDSPR